METEKIKFTYVIIAAYFFILLLLITSFFLFKGYLKRKNKLILDKERWRMQFEMTVLQSKLEIQEMILSNINREMHNNIGQILSLARISLSQAKLEGEIDKVSMVDGLLAKIIVDVRTLSHSMDTDFIDSRGWLESLSALLQNISAAGKITTSLKLDDYIPPINKDRSIILFRIIQEIIDNIVIQSKTDNIVVFVNNTNKDLVVILSNNGKVFDTTGKFNGVGWQELERRAAMIEGKITIKSNPGSGTSIMIIAKPEK